MNVRITERIKNFRQGKIPDGCCIVPNIGVVSKNWCIGSMSGVVRQVKRSIPKPTEPYWRLGLRSHAHGTFHEFVEDPTTVEMKELFQVCENDLVINITFAWEHAIALADSEDDGLLVSHRFPTYVFKSNNLPDFYKYVVTQKWFKDLLGMISPGGAGRNRVMSKSAFLKLPCIIPPIEEQRKIAKILGCCDKVIALKKELIKEKKKQKKALMQKLLDPQSGFRLPGFSGKWKYCEFGDRGTFEKGHGLSNAQCNSSERPCVKYGDIYTRYNTVIRKIYSYTADEIFQTSLQIGPDTLLFTCSGEDALEIGKCVAYLGSSPIAIGGDIIAMHPLYDNALFLAYQQYSDLLIKQKVALAKGNSIVHIHLPEVKKLKVFIPPTIEEQQAIADILSTADQEIDLLEQELAQQEKKKKSLMQLLLTGIVRV